MRQQLYFKEFIPPLYSCVCGTVWTQGEGWKPPENPQQSPGEMSMQWVSRAVRKTETALHVLIGSPWTQVKRREAQEYCVKRKTDIVCAHVCGGQHE